jgi:hypothetical protein
MLPGWLTSTWSQMALTVAGLLSLVVLALTVVFDRVHVAIGSTTIRNSSVLRPTVMTMATWLTGAPPQILQAAVVAAVLAVAMPLSAYHANLARTQETQLTMHDVRACLSPIMDEQAAMGRRRRGTWVDMGRVWWPAFFYLRGFGGWQEGKSSTSLVAKHLLSPDEPEIVLLSETRYQELLAELSANRESVLAEAARFAGVRSGSADGAPRSGSLSASCRSPRTHVLLPGAVRRVRSRPGASDRPVRSSPSKITAAWPTVQSACL